MYRNGGGIVQTAAATIPAAKEIAVEPDDGSGTREVDVPPALRERPSLSDDQLLELADLAITIEGHYGAPQDIEWAHDGARFHILQARPITGVVTQ